MCAVFVCAAARKSTKGTYRRRRWAQGRAGIPMYWRARRTL